jgi:tetratricopeptide (TPR) repeat protein
MRPDDSSSGMDELSAHLDRGWELLDRGNLSAAEKSARRALVVEPESAEAQVLLGQIALQRGSAEGAMARFRKAIELDPDYAEPYLSAAEVALLELDDPEQALELADEVVSRADDQAEYLDALLLKVEALLHLDVGDADSRAREALREVSAGPLDDPMLALRAARSWLDLEAYDSAERYYRQVIDQDPESADAWHGLGMCAEGREDHEAMVEAWLKARELDLGAPQPPWHLTEAEFEKVAAESLDALPTHVRKRLANVPILARDIPDPDIVRQGFDPRILGFFSGVPYPEKSIVGGPPPHLDCILLFKRNIERVVRSRKEAQEEIGITLLHETGHFFALSEEDLEGMGLG